MRSRLVSMVIALAFTAAACSSTIDDVESSDGAQADTSQDDPTEDRGSDAPDPIDPGDGASPPTTFVPSLTGPFNLEGGAVRNNAAENLIVDGEYVKSLPVMLAELPWDTDWSRRGFADWSELGRGLGQIDPRDVIPPIDSPVFETVAAASQWVGPREPGALVRVGDEVRFYPLGILTRHEIVNDVIGDVPVAVTFCPLCNTALVFDRRVDGEVLRFGVSGLLRNSDLVMWDSTTLSLWQQITGDGIVGELAGTRLERIPTGIVSFEQFAEDFPDGRSLAAESGFGRSAYGVNPYRGYSTLDSPFLFSGDIDGRFPALSRVVGVDIGVGKAYPFSVLESERAVNDSIDGQPIVVWLAGDTADALDDQAIAISREIGTAVAFSRLVDGQELTFASSDDDTFVDDQTGSTWSVLGRAIDGELQGVQLDLAQHRNEFWFAWSAFFADADVYSG